MSKEVNEALEAIKAQVEDKFAGVAVKADVDASIEAKADKAEIGELKGALETLEAKFDAMPAPALIKATPEEIQINELSKRRLRKVS